jgi:magnesium and cobalt transporter
VSDASAKRRRWQFAARDERPSPDARTEPLKQRVDELAVLRLEDVMTNRVDVTFLVEPVTAEDVAAAVRDTGHSCFPVVTDELDSVNGVLFVNDLFRSSTRPRGLGVSLPSDDEIARKIRRPPLLLPESLNVIDALEEMRDQRKSFALVLDEHGGVAGVVSTRDLLEPLVGEWSDEFDEEDTDDVKPIREHRWLVNGQAHLDTVNEAFTLHLPDGDYVTIGGWFIERAGKIPEVRDYVITGNWVFNVHNMAKRRISELIAVYYPDGVPATLWEDALARD